MADKRMNSVVEDLVRRFLHDGERDGEEIVQALAKQGFELNEIREAFAWIFAGKEIITAEAEQLYEGERIFSPSENERLAAGFRSELLYLLYHGLISKAEAEKIIIEALGLERPEADKKELYAVLPRVVTDANRLLMLFPRPDGERNHLH